MHLHILGICGTFMGGIAAIAQARRPHRHRLRRQRLPADEHAARGARHRAHRGWDAGAARRRREATPTCSCRQRRVARQSADGGDPRRRPPVSCPARSGSTRTCCATNGCWRSPARTARPPPPRCWRGSSSDAELDPGLPDRRRAGRFRRLGAPDRQPVLRDRGGRVRHRVLRQALEVRPLPAAHRDPQQPRVRPRRHLSRSGGDRDAVPSSGAHRAAATAGSSSTAARRASRACWRRGCWSEVERFGLAEVAGTGPTGRIAVDGTILLGGAPQGTLAFGAARAGTTS